MHPHLYTLAGEMLATQAPTAPVTPTAGGGALTVNVLAVLALSALTWYNAKHKKASWAHLIVAVLLGVALGSGTALGNSCQQIINSGAAALSGIVGSV
ncbi:hypothetical protein [Embleya sp. NPDC001921]